MVSDDLEGLVVLLRTAEEIDTPWSPAACGQMADLLAVYARDVRGLENLPLDLGARRWPANVVPIRGGAA